MSTNDGWTVKAMSTAYLQFPWPYGARELMTERAKVQKVLDLSGQMNYGWSPGGNCEPVFKFPMSFHEGFVRSDAQRITLMDRVRTHYNFNWKRDVSQSAHARTPSEGSTPYDRHYAKVIDILIELQALTEELKPETLALIATCTSAHELQQAMLNARA